ncbi:MAG: hypothetical protein ACREI3_07470 [Nitrospirales bacterium]
MENQQAFWTVECQDGDPDLLVCMSCLNEVFWRKVPVSGCPFCHGVSTFEAFTLEAIRDWGSADLITKAQHAKAESMSSTAQAEPSSSVGPESSA